NTSGERRIGTGIETEPVVDLIRYGLGGVGANHYVGVDDLVVARGEEIFDMPESVREIAAKAIACDVTGQIRVDDPVGGADANFGIAVTRRLDKRVETRLGIDA